MKVFLHNTVAVVQEQFIYQFEVWWFDLTALQLLTLLAVLSDFLHLRCSQVTTYFSSL